MANYSSGFKIFWQCYPRTGGKRAASLAWKRMVQPLFEGDVIDALQQQVAAGMFGTDAQFIPHARTWLNQMRWEDEIEKPFSPAGGAAPVPGKYDDLF